MHLVWMQRRDNESCKDNGLMFKAGAEEQKKGGYQEDQTGLQSSLLIFS